MEPNKQLNIGGFFTENVKKIMLTNSIKKDARFFARINSTLNFGRLTPPQKFIETTQQPNCLVTKLSNFTRIYRTLSLSRKKIQYPLLCYGTQCESHMMHVLYTTTYIWPIYNPSKIPQTLTDNSRLTIYMICIEQIKSVKTSWSKISQTCICLH